MTMASLCGEPARPSGKRMRCSTARSSSRISSVTSLSRWVETCCSNLRLLLSLSCDSFLALSTAWMATCRFCSLLPVADFILSSCAFNASAAARLSESMSCSCFLNLALSASEDSRYSCSFRVSDSSLCRLVASTCESCRLSSPSAWASFLAMAAWRACWCSASLAASSRFVSASFWASLRGTSFWVLSSRCSADVRAFFRSASRASADARILRSAVASSSSLRAFSASIASS
mmetsp:Transcript_37563/g.94241  ORF Transcript_37563/g.94241 Transcript_37563/m.94241 type:complete len:233 (+) Transcript_37563:80-778(+)